MYATCPASCGVRCIVSQVSPFAQVRSIRWSCKACQMRYMRATCGATRRIAMPHAQFSPQTSTCCFVCNASSVVASTCDTSPPARYRARVVDCAGQSHRVLQHDCTMLVVAIRVSSRAHVAYMRTQCASSADICNMLVDCMMSSLMRYAPRSAF